MSVKWAWQVCVFLLCNTVKGCFIVTVHVLIATEQNAAV